MIVGEIIARGYEVVGLKVRHGTRSIRLVAHSLIGVRGRLFMSLCLFHFVGGKGLGLVVGLGQGPPLTLPGPVADREHRINFTSSLFLTLSRNERTTFGSTIFIRCR